MKFIAENWEVILLLLVVIVLTVRSILEFTNSPSEEKAAKVKEWLLYAVTIAEKEFGEKTGQIKLAYVYDMFNTKFPAIAQMVPFELFSSWVDEVLVKFKSMVASNKSLENYVGIGRE